MCSLIAAFHAGAMALGPCLAVVSRNLATLPDLIRLAFTCSMHAEAMTALAARLAVVPRSAWRSYIRVLDSSPVRTKMATSTVGHHSRSIVAGCVTLDIACRSVGRRPLPQPPCRPRSAAGRWRGGHIEVALPAPALAITCSASPMQVAALLGDELDLRWTSDDTVGLTFLSTLSLHQVAALLGDALAQYISRPRNQEWK